MRRFSLPLAVLALALGFTGTAVAGPAPPGTSTEPTVPSQTGIAISVDRDHVTSSFFSLRIYIDRICDVVAETRLYAAHASAGHAVSNYQHACP